MVVDISKISQNESSNTATASINKKRNMGCRKKCYKAYRNGRCLGKPTKTGTTASVCKQCKWLDPEMK